MKSVNETATNTVNDRPKNGRPISITTERCSCEFCEITTILQCGTLYW